MIEHTTYRKLFNATAKKFQQPPSLQSIALVFDVNSPGVNRRSKKVLWVQSFGRVEIN